MGKNGGSRRGAGRKKGSVNKEKREVIDIINQYGGLEERVQKLRELANGVKLLKKEDDGVIIYEKPPDTQANIYLIDRVCGKPKQAIDVKADVEVTWEVMFGFSSDDRES